MNAADEVRLRSLSLWWDGLPGPLVGRPPLDRDVDVDVAVVGAGFTGLWTAYYILRAAPGYRVAILEAETAGFGASGRNGGWCSALFAASGARIAKEHGADAARAMQRAMNASVDEVGRAADAEGIDCRFAKGGTIVAARSPAQVRRAEVEVAEARALGFGDEDLRWLGPAEADRMLRVPGQLGATYTPHCAVLDPARLVRGLAHAVERLGATVYEGTVVETIKPATTSSNPATTSSNPATTSSNPATTSRRPTLRANGYSVRADVVVRATEAWTSTLPRHCRALAPVYSLMIATEPLPGSFWAQTGLAHRESFSDHRRLIIYGQRTADDRLAFGGRGAPYHYGSSVRPSYDRSAQIDEALRGAMVELFPATAGATVTHSWGGPIGVPRDWFSSVGLDRSTGLAWAGGYVGDGVSTTNLAGRTLADLVLRQDSDLVRLPWVGHSSPKWEPEPLRWLGVNAALWATKSADRSEDAGGATPALAGRLLKALGRGADL